MMAGLYHKIALFFLLLMSVSACVSAENHSTRKDCNHREDVAAGFELVESFYSCLTSENPTSECENIFLEFNASEEHNDKKQGSLTWQFIHKHENIFYSPRYLKEDGEKKHKFYDRAAKSIVYYNVKNNHISSYGQLYISLTSTLSGAGRNGIYKEIAFPIFLDDQEKKYKIGFEGIKINGVIIDPYGDFTDRNFNLFEILGFEQRIKGSGLHIDKMSRQHVITK